MFLPRNFAGNWLVGSWIAFAASIALAVLSVVVEIVSVVSKPMLLLLSLTLPSFATYSEVTVATEF